MMTKLNMTTNRVKSLVSWGKSTGRGHLRSIRTVIRNYLKRLATGRTFPEATKISFGPVLEAWRPENGAPTDILRWTITEWCNFKCSYCEQTHERRAPKAGGFTAHAFDNYPINEWMSAIERHFSRRKLRLIITGGEPMLDFENMRIFLNFLADAPWCLSIRIDTNASWTPRKFNGLNKSKILLNCSYHPSQIREETYFSNIAAIKDAGFNIGMINYVLNRNQKEEFKRFRHRVETLGLVMNVSPEFIERKTFTLDEIDGIKFAMIAEDQPYRLAITSPQGKTCLYPAISYEMNSSGFVRVGCMHHLAGSFFDKELPYFGNNAANCPHKVCSCLDKYSFLSEFDRNVADPFQVYVDKLRTLSEQQRGD